MSAVTEIIRYAETRERNRHRRDGLDLDRAATSREAAGLPPLTAEEKAERHHRRRESDAWSSKLRKLPPVPAGIIAENRRAHAAYLEKNSTPEDRVQARMIAKMRAESRLDKRIPLFGRN